MNSKTPPRIAISISVLALMLVILCRGTFAQVTSAIQGQISDPSGASIAGATVKVTNEATGLSRTVYSAADGYYRVPDLPAGTYQMRVEQAGFKTLVQRAVDLNAQAALNINLKLEVGEITQSVEVTGQVPQIETTESRISEVLSTEQIRSLPAIGRGLMWLTMTTPGVQGKPEDSRNGLCCDGLSSFASPALSSGGSEFKAAFFVDGIALHYGDAMSWNLAFTPNLDAVEEVRVSTNPTSAEDGIYSGPQVQMVTKGGTNALHGTGHFTLLDDSYNALPYGARRESVGNWYQRYFGGTVGGAIIKNRLFFFTAYEGLREKLAAQGGRSLIVETEAFKNWVTGTRPNSLAAKLLSSNPPFRYATDNLRDVNGDGIMDLGTVVMDRLSGRTANQYNGRVDYQTSSAKDRFYGSYWRSTPVQPVLGVRPTLDYSQKTGVNLISGVHTHTFTPSSLNDLRVSTWKLVWDWRFTQGSYHVPCIQTNDGLGFPARPFSGACTYDLELFASRTYDVSDTFSWNRGAQSWKFGGNYRRVYMTDPQYQFGDTPVYDFASVIDFANDNPFRETRAVDAATGKQRDNFVEAWNQQLSFFAQNSWQVRPGLTLNLGLRWDKYYAHPIAGIQQPRNTFGPVFTSDQLTPSGIVAIRNQKIERSFDPDLNNFGPRISLAWDPTRSGRTVIRGGFFTLYDELNSLSLYRGYYGNPPISSLLSAGSQFGIPIVYGIAPVGTRDFPINPGLVGGRIDPALGIFAGTRPGLDGYAKDFSQPLVYDANVAYQRQVLSDLAMTVAYHYRRTTNDQLNYNANRFSGDLVDGLLDRLNPFYGGITTRVNQLRRIYHGLVFDVSKRLAQGWQLNASYSYHNGRSNNGGVTEVFKPDLDWARDEPATHNTKMNAVWDLPFLSGQRGALGKAFGGWQLATIWNFESGPYFNPATGAQYGRGGDFNADGQNSDRPDLPTTSVPRSFSQDEWLRGAFKANVFPLPNTVRNGTLPRNYFTRPGYARIDASLAKKFPINERATIQFQAQASNLLNQLNISGASSALTSTAFARASSFYPMRAVQLSVKVIF